MGKADQDFISWVKYLAVSTIEVCVIVVSAAYALKTLNLVFLFGVKMP